MVIEDVAVYIIENHLQDRHRVGVMLSGERKMKNNVHLVLQTISHSKRADAQKLHLPNIPKIELFARNTTPGWEVWGNEVTKYDL